MHKAFFGIFAALSVATLIIACDTQKDVKETVKRPVFEKEISNLTATPDIGKIKLTWKLEDINNVDEIQISLRYNRIGQSTGFVVAQRLSPDTTEATLEVPPLADIIARVRLVSKDGNRSKGKTIRASALHKNVVIDKVAIFRIDTPRNLYIYLPDSYHNTDKKYPVIYMHDGQNLFSTGTGSSVSWRVDLAIDRLVSEGKLEEVIVVGIPHAGDRRMAEYIPYRIPAGIASRSEGKEYAQYIVDTILPYVESKYRISSKREDRAVMGSSLGGLMSFWMVKEYPEIFSFAGMVSPYAPWILDDTKKLKRQDIKIWVDTGTAEYGIHNFNYVELARKFSDIMTENNYRYGENFAYYEVFRGNHNETDWAARVDLPLIFFKGKPANRMEKIEVKAQRLQYPYDNIKWVINPVAYFDNGLRYSLFREAEYSVVGESAVTVSKSGEVNLNGESSAVIKVLYRGFATNVNIP